MSSRRYLPETLIVLTLGATAISGCKPIDDPNNNDDAGTIQAMPGSGSSSSGATTMSSDGTTTTTVHSSDGSGSKSVSSDSQINSSVSQSRTNGARSLNIDNDWLRFSYAYPAAAGNIGPLANMLDQRLGKARSQLESQAGDGRTAAKKDGFPYNKYSFEQKWEIVADLPNWLSLSATIYTFSGGAHGNHGFDSLVWDKRAKRALDPMDMFKSPAALRAATQKSYCAALDRERARRTGAVSGDGFFSDCPKLDELTLFVGSRGGDNFDRIELMAAPYVAGSYAEGNYSVTLPVDRAIWRTVKPQYRGAFAVR